MTGPARTAEGSPQHARAPGSAVEAELAQRASLAAVATVQNYTALPPETGSAFGGVREHRNHTYSAWNRR